LIGWHGVHDLVCHAKEIRGQESFTHWNYIKRTWIQTSPCSISGHLHNLLKQALDLIEIIVLYQFCLPLVLCVHSNIPSIATCLGFMVHDSSLYVGLSFDYLCGTCRSIWLKGLFPWMLTLMVLYGCIFIMARCPWTSNFVWIKVAKDFRIMSWKYIIHSIFLRHNISIHVNFLSDWHAFTKFRGKTPLITRWRNFRSCQG
jgi:hypothetical protein